MRRRVTVRAAGIARVRIAPGMTQRPAAPRAKPLKRPTQARARFTVQAIYDALVRIWQRDGLERVTTREVALETGIAVGTLYDYFPSKTALISGYVRHCIESLTQAIDEQCVQPAGRPWPERLHDLVRLCCGVDTPELPWFDAGMLALEARMAEPKHHRRVHAELSSAWQRVFDACTDLPRRPPTDLAEALFLAVWGGRRYGLLLQLPATQTRQWAAQMERLCVACVAVQTAPAVDT
jgi:AcrR family transcriptional regulator